MRGFFPWRTYFRVMLVIGIGVGLDHVAYQGKLLAGSGRMLTAIGRHFW